MGFEQIEVTIDSDGRVELKVAGVQGAGCLALTEQLERHLGGQVERRLTDEYRDTVVEAERLELEDD